MGSYPRVARYARNPGLDDTTPLALLVSRFAQVLALSQSLRKATRLEVQQRILCDRFLLF
jgi:hypothetical protein